MRSKRPAMTLLRILLAAVFGVMSLGHGPVMAFSHASSNAPHHHQVIDHSGHDHHARDQASSESPTDVSSVPVCYSAGCFISLQPPAISAPGAGIDLLGNIIAAPARVMLARAPGPPDPPPRLQG